MKLKNILLGSAIAFAVPFAASAASLTINDVAGTIESGGSADLVLVDVNEVVTNYTVVVSPDETDVGPYYFDIYNNSDEAALFGIVGGDVDQADDQIGSYGFYSAANEWFESEPGGIGITIGEGDAQAIAYGVDDDFEFSGSLGAGESTRLSFFFDGVNCDGESCPVINFTIRSQISEVPLPAAGFLLLGALGGLAAVRRKKS